MDFNLLQPSTGRKRRSFDHLPFTRRNAVQFGRDKEHLNRKGQSSLQSLKSWSGLTGAWKVWLLECLQGAILRNGRRHLEAARGHKDLVLKREKQADQIGMTAAAILARAKDGNDET